MDYLIKFVRIINSGRLTDRFLTAQIKLPDVKEKMSKGIIFSVLEITNPWSSGSPIGSRIINSFIRSYYTASNSSESVNFELAVKDTNETMGKITRNGETSWIGNLHAIIMVLNNNELYLTQSGKNEAYLFRESKVNHITQDLSQNMEVHPLKTFSNIISGQLKPADKILLATPQLFDYLSVERLKQIMGSNDIHRAAEQIAMILKKEKTRKVNLILLEINTKEEFSSRVIDDAKNTIYLDHEDISSFWLNIKESLNALKPYTTKAKEKLSAAYHQTIKFSQEKIVPEVEKGWTNLKKSSQNNFYKLQSKISQNKITEEKKSKPEAEIKTPKQLKKEKLYKIHHYYELGENKKPTFSEKTSLFFAKIGQFFKNKFTYLMEEKNRSILYIILIIILLAISIFSFIKLRERQNDKQSFETTQQELVDAESKFDDEAKLAILYNERQKAIELLTQIIAVCKKAKNISGLENKANKLENDAQQELDKLIGVIRIKNSKQVSEFISATQFTFVNDLIFAINDNGNLIEVNSKVTGEKKENIIIPESDDRTKLLAYLGDEKNILVYTSEREMYKTTGSKETLERVYPIQDKWSDTDDLVTFFANIYTLDKNASQIYKYTKTDDGYDKKSEYLKEQISLGDVVSFAIDGQLYLLKQNGEIIKLNKGKAVNFSINGIPEPTNTIFNPKKIYTDVEATSLWILDNNRIIELDKNGNFLHQYIFEGLENINDFTIDYDAKKFWLLDSNRLFECNY